MKDILKEFITNRRTIQMAAEKAEKDYQAAFDANKKPTVEVAHGFHRANDAAMLDARNSMSTLLQIVEKQQRVIECIEKVPCCIGARYPGCRGCSAIDEALAFKLDVEALLKERG